MTHFDNEIIVDWRAGDLRQLILYGEWRGCQARNKVKWLLEMDSSLNHQARVRLIMSSQMVELFLNRLPSGGDNGFTAGKWVELDNFHQVAEEAKKVLNK